MKLHLFAHNAKNYIKKGDQVKAYGDWIGEIGNANNAYYAHLHYSVSEGLTPTQIKSYVKGWSMDKIKQYYREPDIDREKMFDRPVDNGQAGYDWLQAISKGYWHPGRDYNGFGGSNTDYGYKFKSPVDGEVVFEGDWGAGWGKVIIIEEKTMYKVDSKLRDAIEKITGEDYKKMDTEKLQEKAGKDLLKEWDDIEKELEKIMESNRQLIKDQDKINQAHDLELKRLKDSLSKEYNDILNQLKEEIAKKELALKTAGDVIKTSITVNSDWSKILEVIIKKIK
jgi:hypothetical protein